MVAVPFRLNAAALALALAPALSAQGDADFYRAFYLEHEQHDPAAARALYLKVAEGRQAPEELRAKARLAADALGEDLAASDFTHLMPRDSLFYAELSRPGEELSLLLDSLGLLGRIEEGKGLAISPLLVDGALGLRGAAVAVTAFDPQSGPSGVLLVHPGDLDVVRGLIETALPAAGEPAPAIGGFPTWNLHGEALVTLTQRLLIASRDETEIKAVIERMQGHGSPSLADNPALADVLASGRGGLLSFCLNAEPLRPMLQGMLAQGAGQDPQAALMLSFLDVQSLRSVSGRFDVDSEGVSVELALELAQGHHNLAFNLLRLPEVERKTLERIPSGAAFFVALGLNPKGDVAPLAHDATGQPIVSFMDFGRELFGNLRDVTVYGMPAQGGAAGPLPDVAVRLGVNDVERSQALWAFALGTAGAASGGSTAPAALTIAGRPVARYSLGGMPFFVAAGTDGLILSPSQSTLERALAAEKPAHSVLDDPLFAADAQRILAGHTLVAMASPGRCLSFASGMMGPGEAQGMAPYADLLKDTVVTFGLEHTDTRLALRGRVSSLPDVSGLVGEALQGHHGGEVGLMSASAPAPAPVAGPTQAAPALKGLRAEFESLASKGDTDAARAALERVAAAADMDPLYLNDCAWAVATEARYGGRFTDVARSMALRANELTEYGNWYYVDTLARIRFDDGDLEEAVRLEEMAVALAQSDPRGSEASKALERYQTALDAVVARE